MEFDFFHAKLKLFTKQNKLSDKYAKFQSLDNSSPKLTKLLIKIIALEVEIKHIMYDIKKYEQISFLGKTVM